MRFSPKSEQQIQDERFPLLDKGQYDFEVFEAYESISKKGNPMIVLKLKLYNGGDPVGFVTDYLMESVAHKLRHACYACGIGSLYDFGEISPEAFPGKNGSLDLGIQKDKTGQYPDKNTVLDYIIEDLTQNKSMKHVLKSNIPVSSPSWEDNMPEPPEWVK